MPRLDLSGEAEVWLYEGPGGWHFLTLPKPLGEEIKVMTAGARTGWGSVRVQATIGATPWDTSVFPDSASGSYVLPVKKAVRAAEHIDAGSRVRFRLSIRF